MWEHGDKDYLRSKIEGKAKILIALLRTNSHYLRFETGRWKVLKEVWEERTYNFGNKGVVEME